jgi:hypothetical protein
MMELSDEEWIMLQGLAIQKQLNDVTLLGHLVYQPETRNESLDQCFKNVAPRFKQTPTQAAKEVVQTCYRKRHLWFYLTGVANAARLVKVLRMRMVYGAFTSEEKKLLTSLFKNLDDLNKDILLVGLEEPEHALVLARFMYLIFASVLASLVEGDVRTAIQKFEVTRDRVIIQKMAAKLLLGSNLSRPQKVVATVYASDLYRRLVPLKITDAEAVSLAAAPRMPQIVPLTKAFLTDRAWFLENKNLRLYVNEVLLHDADLQLHTLLQSELLSLDYRFPNGDSLYERAKKEGARRSLKLL